MTVYLDAIRNVDTVRRIGRVSQFLGLIVESEGPEASWGECCEIRSHRTGQATRAEVIGIRNGKVLLMPYGDLKGISVGSQVVSSGRMAEVPVGRQLLGRVVDAFGNPLDGGPPINADQYYPLFQEPKNPMERPLISEVLETGVKAVDCVTTVGKGQRMGIFAGSGVGKSTLLGMISRNLNADINVIAMIGERGREVLDFVENVLGKEGLAKSVVVVATSDQPPLVRSHAALSATAIAEYFADTGADVVLTMDSITRFAMAQREICLAAGEPPTTRGYTPSVFALLPKLLERSGTSSSGGSITAFYTVLVEGDDMNDPIADHVRSIIDGSIVLSRALANERQFPAIDVVQSGSRLIGALVPEPEIALGGELVRLVDNYNRARDMVDIGAYKAGSNQDLDYVLRVVPKLNQFLSQSEHEACSRANAMQELGQILSRHKGLGS